MVSTSSVDRYDELLREWIAEHAGIFSMQIRRAELLNFCRQRLEAVEQQVKVLEDGQLKPWNPA